MSYGSLIQASRDPRKCIYSLYDSLRECHSDIPSRVDRGQEGQICKGIEHLCMY